MVPYFRVNYAPTKRFPIPVAHLVLGFPSNHREGGTRSTANSQVDMGLGLGFDGLRVLKRPVAEIPGSLMEENNSNQQRCFREPLDVEALVPDYTDSSLRKLVMFCCSVSGASWKPSDINIEAGRRAVKPNFTIVCTAAWPHNGSSTPIHI